MEKKTIISFFKIMNFLSTLSISKLCSMTKAELDISFILYIIFTINDFYNDGIPSDQLFPSETYIYVESDLRVETTQPKKSDISIEGEVSDVTICKLLIHMKITPMCRVNLDRPKWLLVIGGFKQKFVPLELATARSFNR